MDAHTHTHICAHKSRSQRAHTLTYPQTHSLSLSLKNTSSFSFTFPATHISISSGRLTAKESGCLVEMLERRVKSDYSLTQLPSAAGGRSLLLPLHLPSLASFFSPSVGLSVCIRFSVQWRYKLAQRLDRLSWSWKVTCLIPATASVRVDAKDKKCT